MENSLTDHQVNHLSIIFHKEMKLCRCGQPWEAYRLMRDTLEAAPFYEDWEKVVRITGNEGSHHIVLSLMDSVGLLEHGGSVGGSWLTPKGKFLRDVLRRVTCWEDLELEESSPFLRSHECSNDCWAA